MDPMNEFEENLKRKYEFERKELLDSIILNDLIFARDFNGKGKDVHPTGKQRKMVQTIAQTINFNITNTKEDNESVIYFDLNAKPRIFVSSGMINKLEPDSILRKFSRRFLFIFNDVLLLTSKKETSEFFEVKQVLWVSDLRLKHRILPSQSPDSPGSSSSSSTSEDPFSFELVVNNKNQKKSIILSCEDEVTRLGWINDIESTLLAYHRETELGKQLGWFHEIIQGTFYSAAYLGDSILLRKHLNVIHKSRRPSFNAEHEALIAGLNNSNTINNAMTTIDTPDKSGMTALHWAVLRGHEVCARLLLDRGADLDAYQKGLNTPLLLAAVSSNNSETLVRLLIERGADLYARNLKDHDVVFMAVLYGHSSKGLPWLLQLLNSKGLDLNAADSAGATPLHLCAKRNLARPIRMLVDSGADVNAKHGTTQLTPLQMACANFDPDVETIRSFLDKGAYVNWRDFEGRTAFDIVLNAQQKSQQQQQQQQQLRNNIVSPLEDSNNKEEFNISLESIGSDKGSVDDNDIITRKSTLMSSPPKSFKAFGKSTFTSGRYSLGTSSQIPKKINFESIENSSVGDLAVSQQRWRAMETTIKQVGDWAVRALPVLLEICKRGGRCRTQQDPLLLSLRPSFRAALEEAQDIWKKLKQPENFIEFVSVREQTGEDLRLHKANWIKDNHSSICQLCSESFSLRIRRHHCRSCGVLTCDDCSSKRLVLSTNPTVNNNSGSSSSSTKGTDDNNDAERVCDGCFNRLCHEASQPSPDHFRVKQLKSCALDVIAYMEELVRSLDDPYLKSGSIASSNEVDQFYHGSGKNDLDELLAQTNCSSNNNNNNKLSKMKNTKNNNGFQSDQSRKSIGGGGTNNGITGATGTGMLNIMNKKEDSLVEVLKNREAKVKKSEDAVAKFLEATDAYRKVTKKLIEQKIASNRLWGNSDI